MSPPSSWGFPDGRSMRWSRGGEPVGEWSLPSCLAVRPGGVAAGESPIRSRPSFRTSCESAPSLGGGDRSLRCTGRSVRACRLRGLAARSRATVQRRIAQLDPRSSTLAWEGAESARTLRSAGGTARAVPAIPAAPGGPAPGGELGVGAPVRPGRGPGGPRAGGLLREELFELLLAAGVDQDEASIGAGMLAHVQHYQPDPAGSPRRNAGGRGDAVPAGPGARQLRPDPQPPRRSGRGRVDRRRRTRWDDPELIHRPRLIARRLHTRITGPAQA